MSVAVSVRVGNGIDDLDADLDRSTNVHRPPCRLGAKRLSLLKLEDQIDAALVLTDVEERGHVRM